jgi:hypothetical protein
MAEDTISFVYDYGCSAEAIVRKAALGLRDAIKRVAKNPLPENPSLTDLQRGEASPSELLKTFYKALYSGPSPKSLRAKVERQVSSACQDAMFAVSNGG